jgi:dissimilatory sulfite reductase (desulfoviridin) alpha/beta subunit
MSWNDKLGSTWEYNRHALHQRAQPEDRTETGASILFGAKAPILEGAQLSTLTIPFMPMEEPFSELKELIEKIWDWWSEEGRSRERLGELMQRKGFAKFLEVCELKADPRMIKAQIEPLHLLERSGHQEDGNGTSKISENDTRNRRF